MDRQQIGLKLALDALGQELDLSDFDRRLVLQKAVYLAQAARVDLGYAFHWYRRGPYSPALTRDAFALKAELPRGADELKGWALDTVSLGRLAHLGQVFRTFPPEARARRLELLASVHLLLQTRQAVSTDIAGLRGVLLRNEKDFPEAAIREAIEDLKQHGLYPADGPRQADR